jgi:hypothetical protein
MRTMSRQHGPKENGPSHDDGQTGGMHIRRYGRFWAVYDAQDVLVVVALYKKGALEVVRRLEYLAKGQP